MISIERLNSNNLDSFKKLNYDNLQNDKCDKDFLMYYNKEKFLNKVLLKKYVKIFMSNNIAIGYMWCDICVNEKVKIWALYIKEEYIHLLNKNTLKVNNQKKLVYDGANCRLKNTIMTKLNFIIKKKAIVMGLDINKYENNAVVDKLDKTIELELLGILKKYYGLDSLNIDIAVEMFIEGCDEALRCKIQNNVFDDKDRLPLGIYDIESDIMQDYYLPDLCLFIKLNNIAVGYGQVIYSSGIYTVVNFGIIDIFRGYGLGKMLINEIVNSSKNANIDRLSIKVEEDNFIAEKLYKSIGFIEEYRVNQWEQ